MNEKRPEDWTEQELEDADSVLFELPNLIDYKTKETLKIVVKKSRVPDLMNLRVRAMNAATRAKKLIER